jgi:4-diphosphocytidyl-2-C-methyl-D-erythritol kinase
MVDVIRSIAGSVEIEAPAKINLILRILARDDRTGYHEIETIFQAVDLVDRIRIEPTESGGLELDVVGADLGPSAENLAWKAARAFADETRLAGGLRIRLEKEVPAGAGLGGGSSDAAATLTALNALHGAPLAPSDVTRLAGSLGADVSFFTGGAATALGWGRGERLRGLPALPSRPVLIVLPEFGISTRDAYAVLARHRRETGRPPAEPRFETVTSIDWGWVVARHENDFEGVLTAVHADLARIRSALDRTRPALVLLSGSGSAMFAVYDGDDEAEAACRRVEAEGWRAVRAKTLQSLPRPVLSY